MGFDCALRGRAYSHRQKCLFRVFFVVVSICAGGFCVCAKWFCRVYVCNVYSRRIQCHSRSAYHRHCDLNVFKSIYILPHPHPRKKTAVVPAALKPTSHSLFAARATENSLLRFDKTKHNARAQISVPNTCTLFRAI